MIKNRYYFIKYCLPLCKNFGEKASYLKLGFTFPLPMELIKEFSNNVETLYIVEELEPFMEEQIKAAGIKCIGKELILTIMN